MLLDNDTAGTPRPPIVVGNLAPNREIRRDLSGI